MSHERQTTFIDSDGRLEVNADKPDLSYDVTDFKIDVR